MVLSGCEFRSLLTTTLTLASREPRKIQKEWCEQKNETLLKSTTQNFPSMSAGSGTSTICVRKVGRWCTHINPRKTDVSRIVSVRLKSSEKSAEPINAVHSGRL